MVDAWRSDPPQHISVKQGNAYDKYEILEEIGTGAFGVVHRCIEKSTGRVFAAKFVNAYNAAEKETVCKEVLSLFLITLYPALVQVMTMSELRHPSLIRCE